RDAEGVDPVALPQLHHGPANRSVRNAEPFRILLRRPFPSRPHGEVQQLAGARQAVVAEDVFRQQPVEQDPHVATSGGLLCCKTLCCKPLSAPGCACSSFILQYFSPVSRKNGAGSAAERPRRPRGGLCGG